MLHLFLPLALALGATPQPEAPRQSVFAGTFSPIRTWAKPGETVSREMRIQLVQSATGEALRFRTYAQDFWVSADGRSTLYADPGRVDRSCASWIAVDPANQEVAPGGFLEARVSVSVPEGTAPGGYWCAVSLDEQMDPRRKALLGGSGMVLFASFSNAVYVFVHPLELDAKITGLDLDGTSAAVTIRSLANSPLLVEGRVEFLRDGEEQPIATTLLETRVLLPGPIGTVATYGDLPPAEVLPDGEYVVRAVLDLGLEHLVGTQARRVVARTSPSAQ